MFLLPIVVTVILSCNNIDKTKESVSPDTVLQVTAKTDTLIKPKILNQDTTANEEAILDCDKAGPVSFSFSYKDLETKFGRENLTQDTVYVEGDIGGLSTVVYKGSPKELIVVWQEMKKPFKKIASIRIAQKNSVYHFANGLRVGASLRQLVEFNGNTPIKFFGFGWDYSGIINYPMNGKIKKEYPCFNGTLGYEGEGIPEKFLGEGPFSSATAGMPLDKIVLEEISLGKD